MAGARPLAYKATCERGWGAVRGRTDADNNRGEDGGGGACRPLAGGGAG